MNDYTIRVCLLDSYGQTFHQTFTRGAMRISREAFNAFAIATLMTMVETGYTDSLDFKSAQRGTTFPINITRVCVEMVDGANTENEISERFVNTYGM